MSRNIWIKAKLPHLQTSKTGEKLSTEKLLERTYKIVLLEDKFITSRGYMNMREDFKNLRKGKYMGDSNWILAYYVLNILWYIRM